MKFFTRSIALLQKDDASQYPRRNLPVLAVAALGVIYGDIGTSPLYTIKECFSGKHGVIPTAENIFGIL